MFGNHPRRAHAFSVVVSGGYPDMPGRARRCSWECHHYYLIPFCLQAIPLQASLTVPPDSCGTQELLNLPLHAQAYRCIAPAIELLHKTHHIAYTSPVMVEIALGVVSPGLGIEEPRP